MTDAAILALLSIGVTLLAFVFRGQLRLTARFASLEGRVEKVHVALVGYDGAGGIMADLSNVKVEVTDLEGNVQQLAGDIRLLRLRVEGTSASDA